VAEPNYGPGIEPIEVVPVVVLSQVFPARPSSIPDIRNFVRHCLAESPLTEEGTREVGETVFRALLDAAGPTGSIHVAFRIFPEHVEVDVLHSDSQLPIPDSSGRPGGSGQGQAAQGQGVGGQAVGGQGVGGQGVGGQSLGGLGAGHPGASGQRWVGSGWAEPGARPGGGPGGAEHGAGWPGPAGQAAAGPAAAGLGVTGAGVNGTGVTGEGVTGEGVPGEGVTGVGVNGAAVPGEGVTGVGVNGAGVPGTGVTGAGVAGTGAPADSVAGEADRMAALSPAGPVELGGPGQPATFAEWMSSALRSQNMTQEAAARQLGVSVKTISRWVGGTTEPRMRDLRRIQEVFGTLPLS
jgi:Helix-turn-helix